MRSSSLGEKSSRRTKWSMTPRSGASASRRPSRWFTFSSSAWPRCFSVAAAIAVSQTSTRAARTPRRRPARPCRRSCRRWACRAGSGGQADRPRLALVEDALGFQEQRLPEPLGADDDELVVAVEAQEVVDLGRPMQERVVEVFGHADVVGVHGPCPHTASPARESEPLEDKPGREPSALLSQRLTGTKR